MALAFSLFSTSVVAYKVSLTNKMMLYHRLPDDRLLEDKGAFILPYPMNCDHATNLVWDWLEQV